MAAQRGSSSIDSPSPIIPSPVFVLKQSFLWDRKRNRAYCKKKRKSSKSPKSLNTNQLFFNDEFKDGQPQELADSFFLSGNVTQAVPYYTTMLEKQSSAEKSNADPNNNINEEENRELTWSNSYLASKLFEVDKMLEVYPKNPSLYLEKAAVLFFQERWTDAREVLATALTKCTDKSEIRSTIGKLNKLERSLAVGL